MSTTRRPSLWPWSESHSYRRIRFSVCWSP